MTLRLHTRLSVFLALALAGCAAVPGERPAWLGGDPDAVMTASEKLARFYGDDPECYDRATMPSTAVVDSHLHFRPFGGPPLPFEETVSYLERTGVAFANVYGIGQSLPVDSDCEYYLDCVGTPALPSMKNDFANAQDILELRPDDVVLTLSMTFPDLAHPEDVPAKMALLDAEYPGMFAWMGEVNLVKQALMGNRHVPAGMNAIAAWAPFMETLRERGMPIAIHADLGSDDDQTRHLALFEEVLRLYPDNTIVWVHMGLSKELTTFDVSEHIALLTRLLDENPNLYLDISWRVIDDAYFQDEAQRAAYVAFFNAYSSRILPGTDFVAAHVKTFDIYAEELAVTSRILAELDDDAFRDIALGQSYFDILGLAYEAPAICPAA